MVVNGKFGFEVRFSVAEDYLVKLFFVDIYYKLIARR